MSTFETLHAPSATFSSPFLTITYTPAGLAYTFPPHIPPFSKLQALLWPLMLGVIFVSTTLHLHRHVTSVSRQTHTHLSHTRRILTILQRTLDALSLEQQRRSQDAVEREAAKTQLDADLASYEADILALDRCCTLHAGVLATLEYNLEQARVLLGAGVELEASDAGLEVGDDVQTFWAVDGLDSEAGDDDDDEGHVDDLIDVAASDELVWDWMDECADPDECYNCWM